MRGKQEILKQKMRKFPGINEILRSRLNSCGAGIGFDLGEVQKFELK